MKKALSVIMTIVIMLSAFPISGLLNIDLPGTIEASAATMTMSELRKKFPHGKYWNHAGNPGSSNSVNNQDGYTSTPCSVHGVVGTSKQTCNGFAPSGTQLSWQCMGYAEKLGYDATGYNPRNNANGWKTYTSSSALDNLKAGDIVRYKNDGHSIYVTAVDGNTVTYTDCNSDGHCKIMWDKTISKATLKSSFTHVRSAPSALATTYEIGRYKITANGGLILRKTASTSADALLTIPEGTKVNVTKISGSWGYTSYDGKEGWIYLIYTSYSSNILIVYFNANNGSISSDSYKLSSNKICDKSSGTQISQVWVYDNTKDNGLMNASTFGLYKTGYSFAGWGTKASGGTIFDDGDATLIPSKINSNIKNGSCSTTLYAQWKANTLTVNYNVNGGSINSDKYKLSSSLLYYISSGKKVDDIWTYNETHENGLYNSGTFGIYKTGYSFAGWGTKSSSGTVLDQNNEDLKPTDINTNIKNGNCSTTLYAQWKANSYKIAFNGNGSTSGSMSNLAMTYGSAKNLTANAFSKTGYTFNGWNTKADGKGTAYADKASVKNLTSTKDGTVTLYAQWKANSYKIAFNGNGATSGSMSNLAMTYGSAKNLTANAFSKTGYTFNGWNTKANGTGTAYVDKASVKNLTSTKDGTVTLYAQWTKNHTHSYSSKVTKAPTCTESGIKTFTCSCGNSYTQTINATGHSYVKNIVSPTCTEQGYTKTTCSNCSYVATSNYVSAKGHTYGDWVVTKQPTTTQTGIKTKTCHCGATITETMPKLTAPEYFVEFEDDSIDLYYKDVISTNLSTNGSKIIYTSSDTSVAVVNENGKVTAVGTGDATITATVEGTSISDTCEINVSYAWWQWIILILLLGFIWY
ncbi:MAG: InlB B-repeat-containing protein [Clostridia bacterium]|nr:InlB B-repeat-containing protein [Clostridia bacterium]